MQGKLSETEKTIWFVVYIVEGVVIIFCNIISLIDFSRKARNSKPCLLLMNQSLADLLVGIEAIHYSLRFVTLHFEDADAFQKNHRCASTLYIVRVMAWNFVIDLSLNSLALIALERTFAVFKPFRHRVLKSRQYYHCILGAWILSLLPSILVASLRCYGPNIELVTFSLSNVAILGTLFVLVIAYSGIYIKVRFFPVFPIVNAHARSQIKLSLTLFFTSAASMATVLPSFGIQLYLRNHNDLEHSSHLVQCAVVLVIANSFINFIIYAWRFPEFVTDMKRFFCCKTLVFNMDFLSYEMRQNAR